MSKYDYLLIIQGDYGWGWEDVSAWDKSERKEAKAELLSYQVNDGHPHRIINRRELKRCSHV